MYQQFNKETRKELATLLRAKLTPMTCANELGMDKSSVTREISRYKDKDGVYRGASAHKKYLAKRVQAKAPSRIIENDAVLRTYIQERLTEHDSPEQIAGRVERTRSHQLVSHETVYQWIFTEHPELKVHLRRIGHKGKYRRKRGTKIREKVREEAKVKRIDTRPSIVERRGRLGDFEGDTIIGKDKTKRLLTNVDRMSGYGLIDKMSVVTADLCHKKLQQRFKKIPQEKRHTYTYDNGTEIGKMDTDLEKKIGMDVYRAYPYHSWERGTNENYNGLVRDFFPKGTDFATISETDIRDVERNLNNRPRKRLGYLTPHEVFVLGMKPGALQA